MCPESFIYIYGFSIAYLTLFLILLHFQLCAQISGSPHVVILCNTDVYVTRSSMHVYIDNISGELLKIY